MKIFFKGKKFINKCLKGLSINNKSKHIKYNIKTLSVIIPAFNCEKSIKSSIKSIQNQNFSEIEILLVNDFSKDNTLKIIGELKKEDSRIIIINNNKNMGTLYSRSIGALSAKGEYIFTLDNDDMFFDIDVFDFIYRKAKKESFDIIGFKSIFIKRYNNSIRKMRVNPYSKHKNNLILHQPNLGIYPISRNKKYIQNDVNIWSKCIKTYIYKKGVNCLGILRYSNFIIWAEDTIIIFIIFNIAQSFRFIDKFGVIHKHSHSTASYTESKIIRFFGELFLLNIILVFSNNQNKNLVALYFFQIKKRYKLKKFKFENNLSFLKYIMKKILKCKFISNFNKKKILKDFKSFII